MIPKIGKVLKTNREKTGELQIVSRSSFYTKAIQRRSIKNHYIKRFGETTSANGSASCSTLQHHLNLILASFFWQ